MIKRALLSIFRRTVRLYFRQIERVGDIPRADTRGRVFVSNHQNALVDPILVLTDAPCEISPIAKSTLWSIPGLRWLLDAAGAVPITRRKDAPAKDAASNDDTFDKIADHLTSGGNILIFPEGTSHSEPHLAPLRTGAAWMLLAADERRRATGAGEPLTFQAAALEFDAADKFRSRCLLLWGPVRQFDEVGGTDDEDRVRAATAIMEADLKELLVEGETHAERRLIARVAELFANDRGDGSLGGWNAIGRQVELANQTLRSLAPVLADYVALKVNAYFAALDRLGLSDDRLATGGAPSHGSSTLRLALLAPLAIPGMVLYAIPYWVPRLVARSADQDAASTYKLAAGLVVYPIWMAGLVGASIAFVPPPWKLPAIAVAVLSPFAALAWLDALEDRANHRAISDAERAKLAELRAGAMAAIAAVRASMLAG